MTEIHKYPRTRHLEGSRLQPGDADLDQVPLDALRGRYCVVEEKLDGANAGISLDADSRLRLQSRGHVLIGGAREKHWDLFKRWARAHATALGERATGGLTIFGEWLYAKHTIFYDQLPHYFLEFDIRDATGAFWSTERRLAHLAGSPIISVPVLWHGVVTDPRRLPELVGHALYKSPRWRERLRQAATDANVDPDRTALETDPEPTAEGLYIKVEDRAQGIVVDRYKWLRASFLSALLDSGSHWLARPIVANQLADGVDLFAVAPCSPPLRRPRSTRPRSPHSSSQSRRPPSSPRRPRTLHCTPRATCGPTRRWRSRRWSTDPAMPRSDRLPAGSSPPRSSSTTSASRRRAAMRPAS